jgi:hypothetical protein
MTKRVVSLVTFLLAIAFLALTLGCSNSPSAPKGTASGLTPAATTTYYFATFGSDSDQKLYIYSSANATSWSQYYSGYSGPTGVLRDPSIYYANGLYYIAFTTQSWTTSSTSFAIASSPDLKTWTTIATVPCGISGTYYTWAPDWFVDGSTVKLLVNIGPSDANMRPYVFTAQNSGLTSWSGPVDMGIGENHIDAFTVKSGSTYHCFCKDETSKNIMHATASSLTGPWTFQNTLWNGYEGVCLLQMGSTWRIWVDHYSAGDGLYTATSSDLTTWSSLSKCGFGRHGSCIAVTTSGTPTPTPTPGGGIVSGNIYSLICVYSGSALDNYGATTNGALMGQWTANGGNNQKWKITANGSYYTLVCQTGGLALDNGNTTTTGAHIMQWAANGGSAQNWQLTFVSGSTYTLKNQMSGLMLDNFSVTTNGKVIAQYPANGGTCQQWTIQ